MMSVMFGYFLIAFIVLVGPLAYLAGVDSRIDEIDWRAPLPRLSRTAGSAARR